MTGKKTTITVKGQKIIPSEYQECRAFWDYCQIVLKLGKKIVKHCNEGQRNPIYGNALKHVGLTRGVPDYQYWPSNGKYHGLWIEMKRIDGRYQTKDKDQDAMIELLNANDHYASYAYGANDAIKIYTDYVNNNL